MRLPVSPRAPILALAAALLSGCSRPASGPSAVPVPVPAPTAAAAADTAESPGLRFRLSEGAATVPAPRRDRAPAGVPLSAAEAERLFRRVPALRADSAPRDSFVLPPQGPPPPRTGATLLASFPPPDSVAPPPASAPAPLRVTRHAPEGEIETGAEVTLAFSQPMVPLATVSALEARAVPVRLTPQPPGRWRWTDVSTLRFEPGGRLPMATVYRVEVPAGVRSALGGTLAESERWSFATPPPAVASVHPQGERAARQPVIVLRFDQRVDPGAVLPFVRVQAGRTDYSVRPATPAEVEADSAASALAREAGEGRWLAVRPLRELPQGASVRVSLAPGAPSAEGPRPTREAQEFGFRTYGPLRVAGSGCVYQGPCRPGMPWVIELSNPVDPASWSAGLVRVEPTVPDLSVQAVGDRIVLRGATRAGTRYRVTLDPALRDTFGQALGARQTVSFSVGASLSRLWGPEERMVVLDPSAPPRIPIHTRNYARLRVRINRVRPEDWSAFAQALSRRRPGIAPALPGRTVVSRVIEVGAAPEEVAESWIDLSPALDEGLGQALLWVEPEGATAPDPRDEQGLYGPTVALWVQSTRIGLSAFADAGELLAWATSLVDGAPLPDVRLSLLPTGTEAGTGANGTATLEVPGSIGGRAGVDAVLVARRGPDLAILPENAGRGGYGGWGSAPASDFLAWHTFTDRSLYRPGEEVHLKGWIRRLSRGRAPLLALPAASTGGVSYRVVDVRGNEIAAGTAPLSALGGFDARFRLPATTTPGYARIQLEAPGAGVEAGREHGEAINVQDFRRPEYEVSVTSETGPLLVGDGTQLTARAAYYSGGGLPGAAVTWNVTAAPAVFSPPGWDLWSFGIRDVYGPGPRPARGGYSTQRHEGVTGADGVHRLRVHFDRALPPRTYAVTAEATVMDVNRQAWSASSRQLVHPAALYLGLRTARAWQPRGQPIEVDAVAVALDGTPVAGRPVRVRAARLQPRLRDGRWEEVEADPQTCALLSAAEPLHCSLPTGLGGRYRVTAEATDAAGRPTRTEIVVWVAGEAAPGESRMGEQGRVEIVADRESYQPGDTAQLLLRAPFFPARGLLSILRGGIVRMEPLTLAGATHVVRVPIGEDDIAGLQARVELVGAGAASATQGASGQVELSVPPLSRTLAVHAAPLDSVAEPGARTRVAVTVRDAAGRPVPGAEVALVVVDEAVLALGGARFRDPIETFYPARGSYVSSVHLRPHLLLPARTPRPEPGALVGLVADATSGTPLAGATVRLAGTAREAVSDEQGHFRLPGLAAGTYTLSVAREGYTTTAREARVQGGEAPSPLRLLLLPEAVQARDFAGMGAAGGIAKGMQDMVAPHAPPPPPAPTGSMRFRDEAAAPIALRSDFDPLALFAAALRTDAEGRTQVEVTLPGNPTRYRVVATAVAGAKFYGLGEAALTARGALTVRPSPPRFLNYGDHFELPVVVQNQTGSPLEVAVAVRAEGVAMGGAGRRVLVPAHDRVEVRVPGGATRPGLARFQVVAVGGSHTDAAEFTLPVWTPATAEAFATYGAVDGGPVALPLAVPRGVLPGWGGLEVTTSATALQELTDALLALVQCPFDYPEPIASRILAVAGLRDVLAAFRAEGLPSPEALRDSVQRDLRALEQLQNPDGGFGLWTRDGRSWPFVSIHVAHALQRAREKGYAVSPEMLSRSESYLRGVERALPDSYPLAARRALTAYALYVRDRLGDPAAPAEAARLVESAPLEQLPLEAVGWVLSVVHDDAGRRALTSALLRHLANRATETAATATFATSYEEGEYLLMHSARRADAVVLEALIAADRDSELIPKVVRGLLEHRARGRWQGTQENAWALLALDRYFAVYEAEAPSFTSRVWLGGRFAGGHRYQGRTTERHHLAVPMRALAAGDSAAWVVIAKEGTGRMYFRAGLRYAPADLNLAARQSGFAVERAYSAVDDSADVRRDPGGLWRIRAGARVRVTLTLTAPSRRLHVALLDPLPAGLEAVNPELDGSQSAPPPGPRGPRPARGVVPDSPPEPGLRWRGGWWEHQALRDERAEAFASLLPAGVYGYSYIARATTPGDFVVPPARAEEMYHPESFGRSATERVRVEER